MYSSIHLSNRPSIHLSIHPSILSCFHLFIHSFIHSSILPYIHSFIHLPIHLSVRPSILSFIIIHSFICLFIHSLFIHSLIHPSMLTSYVYRYVKNIYTRCGFRGSGPPCHSVDIPLPREYFFYHHLVARIFANISIDLLSVHIVGKHALVFKQFNDFLTKYVIWTSKILSVPELWYLCIDTMIH